MDRTPEEAPVSNNSSRNIPTKKFREKLWIFIGCLVLSGAMWTFTELTKEYTTDIKYKLAYTNVPDNLLLVDEGDSTLTVGITAQGFELLEALYLKRNKTLEIDLSNLRIKPEEHGFSAFISSGKLLSQIGKQLKSKQPPVYVKPDTLYFRFSEVTKSRVPVIPNLKLSFSPQYGLFDSIQFEPRYVSVSSIKNITDTLTVLYSDRIDIRDIDSSFTISVPISKPVKSSLIRLSHDTVNISVKVARFTEKELEIPVNVNGVANAKVFPEKVSVKCLIPMQLYKDISPSLFELQIDPGQGKQGSNKVKVQILRFPAHCRVLSIEPEEVEYLIINK